MRPGAERWSAYRRKDDLGTGSSRDVGRRDSDYFAGQPPRGPSAVSVWLIFYQAVRDHSATKSGIDLLPYMLGTIIALISAGQILALPRRLPHSLRPRSGPLYTLSSTSSVNSSEALGSQILAGVGMAAGQQTSLIAIPRLDSPTPPKRPGNILRIVFLVGVPIAGIALIAALINTIRIVKMEVAAVAPAVTNAESDVETGAIRYLERWLWHKHYIE
ncbi:hypothetical protein C8R46DRAFT_1211121 [Mycena filopes]|nr:hypothetical protein C8R46DRAFT_1211121 [Mycena filopes]